MLLIPCTFPPFSSLPLPTDNPPCDLHFCDSVPVLVVCLVCFCFLARKENTVTYKGVPVRLLADFSKETLQARKGWKEVFTVMKGKDLHPRLLGPAKLSFRMEGRIKCFLDKVKLKEFIITKPLLYEMLKGLI